MNLNKSKILVISSYSPPSISGSSVMMFKLLKYFPEGSYEILTTHSGRLVNSDDVNFRLPVQYYYFDSLKDSVLKEEGLKAACEQNRISHVKTFIKHNKIIYSIVRFLSLFLLPINILRKSIKIIKKNAIDSILVFSDYGSAFIGGYFLSKLFDKPLHVHFFDLYADGDLYFGSKLIARIIEKRIFKSAESISVMNDELQQLFFKKYGRTVDIIYNSVDIEDEEIMLKSKMFKKSINIVFTGTISWPQEQAIKNLIRALKGLPDVTLQLYTPHTEEFMNQNGIYQSETVVFLNAQFSEMRKIHREADVLFVPLSFNTEKDLIINTASPGKAVEYMVSGTPILVHSPKESYISQYFKDNKMAVVVDENSVDLLRQEVEKIPAHPETLQGCVNNASRRAKEFHISKYASKQLENNCL